MTTETNGGWIENIPAVEIELMENGNIRVTDKSDFAQDYAVDLHPVHLRLIAERMGLAREVSASEAGALQMVEKLARRLRVLQGRVEQLQKWLAAAPDTENADITAEYWFNDATLDLANEFVRELDEWRVSPTAVPRDTNGTGVGAANRRQQDGDAVANAMADAKQSRGGNALPTSDDGDSNGAGTTSPGKSQKEIF